MKEKIIQFGEGGFLRGFADWMIQTVNEKTDFGGKVVVVQPIENGMCDMLSAQDCVYTHVCRGVEGVDIKKIDAISRCVKPHDDFDLYLALAENPDFRFIISNTTEAGICFENTDKIAERLAKLTGAKHFPHPFGCSQLGDDQLITQKILRGMVNHPNAGGVLVLGLGCENNNIDLFKEFLGQWNDKRVKFLNTQDSDDEIVEGVRLIDELKKYAAGFKRERVHISKLKVGLKCGGSDGFSGITANPLVGRFCDKLNAMGGSCVLTEVPEMFGAEHLLMNRCENEEIFQKTVSLINNFKDYYIRHNQVVYENPSPGNKKGGITTLEEKSLGCVQKGGLSTVVDVLDYGDVLTKNGLSLLNGPGNDIVAVTNLMAAGVHMILFTTGRGTPLGTAVPTIKIATNEGLAKKKSNWIDFDASPCLEGADLSGELFNYALEVASGKQSKNEENGYEEISIFKDGVTL